MVNIIQAAWDRPMVVAHQRARVESMKVTVTMMTIVRETFSVEKTTVHLLVLCGAQETTAAIKVSIFPTASMLYIRQST